MQRILDQNSRAWKKHWTLTVVMYILFAGILSAIALYIIKNNGPSVIDASLNRRFDVLIDSAKKPYIAQIEQLSKQLDSVRIENRAYAKADSMSTQKIVGILNSNSIINKKLDEKVNSIRKFDDNKYDDARGFITDRYGEY